MNQQIKVDKPQFSQDQKFQLVELGLNKTQIEVLENILPRIKVILTPPPTLGDVREYLNELLLAITKTNKKINKFKNHGANISARTEAFNRVMESAYEIYSNGDFVDSYIDETNKFIDIIQKTIKIIEDSPETQRRKIANPFAIRCIEKALLDGFIEHHKNEDPDYVLPPYELTTSSSPTSQFYEIVHISFVAIGETNPNPERAIRKHIAKKKESIQIQREAIQNTMRNVDE